VGDAIHADGAGCSLGANEVFVRFQKSSCELARRTKPTRDRIYNDATHFNRTMGTSEMAGSGQTRSGRVIDPALATAVTAVVDIPWTGPR
jgi:hypothetical protein